MIKTHSSLSMAKTTRHIMQKLGRDRLPIGEYLVIPWEAGAETHAVHVPPGKRNLPDDLPAGVAGNRAALHLRTRGFVRRSR